MMDENDLIEWDKKFFSSYPHLLKTEIRKLHIQGLSVKEISKKFDINLSKVLKNL